MKKRIIISAIHLFFLLLACFVMIFTANQSSASGYEYVRLFSMAAITNYKFNTYIAAFICVIIILIIDFALVAFHAVEAINKVKQKKSAKEEFLKTIFWCVMGLICVISLYIYFMYYIAFIT